ncbi:acidic mammalian chitinase-like, partial [Microtus oregoni]|uniref:acidic mammalian chitinase-like n=1 Tax=Microtus oregoni TaxID=111838 RepID=UPI001BB1B24D
SLLLLLGLALLLNAHLGSVYNLVFYFSNWAQYRPGLGRFTPDNIDPCLCTHLIYAFAGMQNNEITTIEWNDVEFYKAFNGLKNRLGDLASSSSLLIHSFDDTHSNCLPHVMNSKTTQWRIGDVNSDTTLTLSFQFVQDTGILEGAFSHLGSLLLKLLDGSFVDSTTQVDQVAGCSGLAGINLSTDDDTDKDTVKICIYYIYISETNFKYACLVLQEIREAFEKEANENNKPRLLITAAVAAGVSTIEAGYEICELSQYLDQIHVMTYDLHGSWDDYTGENSSLYKYPTDTGSNAYLNVEYAMNSWKNNGVPAEKLIVGFPEYGHNFLLSNPSNDRIGAPTSGAGPAGPYTREARFWAYYEICTFLKNGATEVWDAPQEVPYAYKGNVWVGYDNVRSFNVKTQWLKQNNFGGAMIWAIDLDDFTGSFCGQGKFPLTSTLNKALDVPTSGCTAPDVPTDPTEPVTSPPGSGSRSGSGSSGGSSEGSGFCAAKADGLYPVVNDRHAFWHCSHGITYLQHCPAGLVFDTSCNCCNWP